MRLDFYDVFTGECSEKEFNIREVFLYEKFQCIIKSHIINGYEIVEGFGWDEEIEYDINEVLEYFRLLNDYVLLTIMEDKYKDMTEIIKVKKEKLSHNKWNYTLEELEAYSEPI